MRTTASLLVYYLTMLCVKSSILPSHVSRPLSSLSDSSLSEEIFCSIKALCHGLNQHYVDAALVADRVSKGAFQGISETELDGLAAETAAYMSTDHPDYAVLAARIAIKSLHKATVSTFSEAIEILYRYVEPKTGLGAGFISDKVYDIVQRNKVSIDTKIQTSRDFNFDYFGIKTLEKSYLLKIGDKVVERLQYLLMRVVLGIHMEDENIEAAFETYDLMSEKWFVHASPTLFHSGTCKPQLSSCLLLGVHSDSIEGIYSTLHQCALISKSAGGIGLSVQNIRAKGSYIKGTKGISNGLLPILRVFRRNCSICGPSWWQGTLIGWRETGSISVHRLLTSTLGTRMQSSRLFTLT